MKLYSIILFCVLSIGVNAQYDFEINIKGGSTDTLIIGNYFADKQLVKDTLIGKDGKFNWSDPDTVIHPGVYFMLENGSQDFAQFFVPSDDQNFKMDWDVKKGDQIDFKGSEDNEVFSDYVQFLDGVRPKANAANQRLALADSTGVQDMDAEKELEAIDKKVQAEQERIVKEYPNSISANFIRSTLQLDLPEFEGKDAQYKTYRYYKKHYFDNLDLGNPANLLTPFIHQRVDYYIENLTQKDPDSTIHSIDYLLTEMRPSNSTYQYYLSHFLNKYAKAKIIGFDAVYVHLVDVYYNKENAPWVSEENLSKIKKQADDFRTVLIGKKFPDITTYMADSLNTPVRLWDVESPYTVLVFWAHDCGHCTKAMPDIVKFYDEYESKGVTLISICTKGGKKTEKCIEAIPKKNMEKFINTFDEFQRYRRKTYIPSTPKIFILDKDKNIMIKDLPAKELINIMPLIIEEDQNRQLDNK